MSIPESMKQITEVAEKLIAPADAFNTIAQAASINPDIVDNIQKISKHILEQEEERK